MNMNLSLGPKKRLGAEVGMYKQRYWFFLIVIPVFFVFVQVISFDFLKYDDTINVSENKFLLDPSTGHLLSFWKAPFLGLYIPVTYTVWTGLAVISLAVFNGRLDPGLFHLLNLVIHVCNCLLVFFIIRKLFALKDGSVSGNNIIIAAALGALVFGLHPVQVETVSWVTGLKGLLGGLFALCAIHLYLASCAAENNFSIYVASTGLLILAILSMPSAVAVPVMLFFIMLWVDRRITGRTVSSLMPWVAIAMVAVMITRIAQPMAAGAESYPWLIRPLVALDAVMFYIHKIFWPNILAIDYCRTPVYVSDRSWFNPYLLLMMPVAGFAYRFRRRPQWLSLGCAFVAGILPVSGLLPFANQQASTVADRYLYLPMAIAAVAVAVAAIIIRKPRPWIISLFFLLLVFLGARSFYQCRAWKNTESIMGHTLQYYPCSFRANLNYGIALMSKGDFTRAIPFFENARRLKPDDPLPYYNMGLAYAGTGDGGLYEQQYQKLTTMDKAKAGRLKQAAALFEKLDRTGTVNGWHGNNWREREE
jgi:hypothetical protein